MLPLNYTSIFCIRFNFGVPLEDIFPPDDIHPRLHNLFYQTSLALKNNPKVPLGHLLSKFEVCISEALELKDALIDGKLTYEKDLDLSSFFWLLRHFFGLLPLPLFPRFTETYSFNWEYLATQCRIFHMKSNHELTSEISRTIHKLPAANIRLVYAFINFLRKICLFPNSTKKLNWNNVVAVTTYFSSSLFFRPFRPGFVTRTDKLYYPLLCYLLINWRRIRSYEKEHLSTADEKLYNAWEYEKPSGQIRAYNNFVKNRLIDCGCQTSSWLLTDGDCGDEERPEEIVSPSNLTETRPAPTDLEIQIEQKREVQDESPVYEEISSLNANSETIIYKKDSDKNSTPKILFRLLKANRSLGNVISKIKTKSLKVDGPKYDLLEDSKVKKVQSLHAHRCVKESPNIKYKKLMTL